MSRNKEPRGAAFGGAPNGAAAEGGPGRVGAQSGLGPGPGWVPHGPLWAHIWAHMSPYGPYIGPYGPLWVLLDRSWKIP